MTSDFLTLLRSEVRLEKAGERLERWYLLDFTAFVSELDKRKAPLSLRQKGEWLSHFESHKAAALTVLSHIEKAEKTIDSMVCALYGLSDDEIKTVEASYAS